MPELLTPEEIEMNLERKRPNRILVGITNYADTDHLEMLLQSIRWYTYDNIEFDLVVCDDGTRAMSFQDARNRNIDPIALADKTAEVCKRFGAALIEHEQNRGIPSAWNTLCNAGNSNTEIIVLLNNDLLMVPDWLKVMVHFLDTNKDNPHVGSCYFNPHQPWPKDDMRAILPLLAHRLPGAIDQVTREPLVSNHPEAHGIPHLADDEGVGQGLGRVMCPAGCSFAFRKEVYEEVGPFDERLTSFHEESDWGTRAAAKGRASFGFPYPRPYHAHGFTFGVSPELRASERMRASRRLYREIWNVPQHVPDDKYFNYVNKKLMSQIPPVTLKFLRPNPKVGDPIEHVLPGGEHNFTPFLEEVEDTYSYSDPCPGQEY